MKKQTSIRKRKTTNKKAKKPNLFKRSTFKFIPALTLLAVSVIIQLAPSFASAVRPNVLGYATSTDVSGLLSHTNAQRAANGVAALAINGALNSAAQAKANDMVTRNYWSHNTPDGQEPWVFFTQAGYSYKAAGENLAYGFATSNDYIIGWMNSPPHRENLLSSAFFDVGFGIANSANYVGKGEETVVVAMYGAKKSSSSAPAAVATTPSPSAPAVKKSVTTPAPSTPPAPAPATAEAIQAVPVPEPVKEPAPEKEKDETALTAAAPTTATPSDVHRIQLMTGGSATWSASLLATSLGCMVILWLLHRGLHFKRLILSGESFIVHHLHLDLTVFAFLVLGWTLLGTSGVIR